MAIKRYIQVVNDVLAEEMERDPDIFYIGQDVVAGLLGFSRGLVDKFGTKRIIDTPISEAASNGLMIGAAMKGLRPVMEFGINSLQYVSMEMMVNQAMKLPYMTGGQYKVPVTWLISSAGGGNGSAAHHSDSTWAQLMHMGMKVLCPSNVYDLKGLIKAAIREDDPVAVYMSKFVLSSKGEVPDEEYIIPIGKGDIKHEGTDITVVAAGHLAVQATIIAKEYEEKGISIEVIDPRTLYPIDKDLIIESVKKTGKLLVADDGYRMCSWSSEVAAIISEEAFEYLKAPIKRITRPMTFPPASLAIEPETMPYKVNIAEGINQVLGL